MRLMIPASTGNYHGPTQIARVRTEAWMAQNGYCPRCGHVGLLHESNNKPVADFHCPACNSVYEQKSKNGQYTSRAAAGSYQKMIEQIKSRTNPDIFFLSYDKESWTVKNLFVVPKHFFHQNTILCRKPLSATAKRAGWTGCEILLSAIPKEGLIYLIRQNEVIDKAIVMKRFQKTLFLANQSIDTRGWLLEVLQCVNNLSEKFTLSEVYSFKEKLQKLHPDNHNIKAKIRQQLQLLRNHNIIQFIGRGRYTKLK